MSVFKENIWFKVNICLNCNFRRKSIKIIARSGQIVSKFWVFSSKWSNFLKENKKKDQNLVKMSVFKENI